MILTTLLLSTLAFSNAIIDEETMKRRLNGDPLYEIVQRTEDEFENTPLIQLQFPKIVQHTSDTNLALLDEIQFSALRCQPDSCSGPKCTCKAAFCKTKEADANAKPENFPTFNQVTDSDFCHAQQKLFELNDIYDEIQNHDKNDKNPVELIVFDMGNTKAPERFAVPLKVALPTKKIVSNAQPLTEAMTMCDNVKNEMTRTKGCNKNAVLDLTRKAVGLLCRSTDTSVNGCVLVLNPEASDSLEYLDMGDIPVAYVYGPSELIVSNYPIDLDRSACNKYKRNKPMKRKDVIRKKGYDESDVPSSINCAAAAASNMEQVLKELKNNSKGKHFAINTLDLPYALEDLIKEVWGVTLNDTTKDTMVETSKKDIFGVSFNEFLEKKSEKMDFEMKEIASEFIDDLYDELELEDDRSRGSDTGRKLMKKVRLTDWPSSR